MLSVIIPTSESERALLRTLAPLVAGATAGLVRDVIVTDAGSRDDTAKVADVAGCRLMVSAEPLAARLRAAAQAARGPWLLFLRPGTVLEAAWVGETTNFIERAGAGAHAAVFRPRADALRPAIVEAFLLLKAALRVKPRPEQGLLIARQLYDAIGGHAAAAADPETDLIRRLGRRRMVMLGCAASRMND